jgi:hypothetical protein
MRDAVIDHSTLFLKGIGGRFRIWICSHRKSNLGM